MGTAASAARDPRRWLAGLCCALALLASRAALAASDGAPALSPPQQVIAGVSEDFKVVLRDHRERLADRAFLRRVVDTQVLPRLDLEGLTSLVLGPWGRDATPAQRAAFIDAFKELVINTYAHAAPEIGPWELRWLPMRPEPRPDRALVRTEVLRPRALPIAVDYRMVERDGRWLVRDVLVEGVSLLASYRDAFSGIARERGLDGLIAELRRRNATAPDV